MLPVESFEIGTMRLASETQDGPIDRKREHRERPPIVEPEPIADHHPE